MLKTSSAKDMCPHSYSHARINTAPNSSTFYRQLEREETKLWHLSVLTLYDLWLEEKETGKITYPEEA